MMTLSASSPYSSYPHKLYPSSSSSLDRPVPFFLSPSSKKSGAGAIRAAKQQQKSAPAKKGAGKRRPPEKPQETGAAVAVEAEAAAGVRQSHPTSPLPKPPAGFVLDAHGRVLAAASKRIATIVDATNNLPLECVIRRVFQSSQGDECMLLCPVNDDEVEAIIPSAAYALAKIHMHLVVSGFCYTARGGFCYSEEDILEFHDGEDIEGLPSEGVEITCFHLDKNGALQIADDDLLEDLAVIGAIDEETEFNALVEEEAALLESLLGKDD
ncbi:hypothetical protein ACMD2_10510 [Ananas comosus]|uniref:Uncharacterized protein n=1 Tax=Ananas comosus TaxID=4615 RepID=A0A199UTI4_ANACO|nr:hypothetical protein ACMD2_10510 [Ananas comosus]